MIIWFEFLEVRALAFQSQYRTWSGTQLAKVPGFYECEANTTNCDFTQEGKEEQSRVQTMYTWTAFTVGLVINMIVNSFPKKILKKLSF